MTPVDSTGPDATQRFFVVGSGRCGTQFLRAMLILHPEVRVFSETHWLVNIYARFGEEPVTGEDFVNEIDRHYDSGGHAWIQLNMKAERIAPARWPDEFLRGQTAAQPVVAWLQRLEQFFYGDCRWVGDKTPQYGLDMVTVKKMFPEARFVHVVRNGVLAARSMLRHPGFIKAINADISMDQFLRYARDGWLVDKPDEAPTMEQALQLWEKMMRQTREQGRRMPPGDYLEINYEALLTNAVEVLTQLADFVGFPADRRWLRRASALPKPFYQRVLNQRFSEDNYLKYYEQIADLQQELGYPPGEQPFHYPSQAGEYLRSVRYWSHRLQTNAGKVVRKLKGGI